MPYLIKDADYPVGGATVEWYSWIKGFEANNCEVGVLTWKGAEKYVENNKIINLIETFDPKAGIRKLRWPHRYRILFKAVKRFKPDYIIQGCAGFETGIMAHIGKKLNIPFIYRVANDIDTDNRINNRLNYRQIMFFRYGLKRSSAIFCQNVYQFERINKLLPNTINYIIHNPFYYNGRLPEIKKRSERSYIAWIGIFHHQKNLPRLYNVAKTMSNVVFKIAGKSDGSELDKNTENALEGLKQCSNVEFMGYLTRTEILPFLAQAYLLLNTSHYEGFSNTYLESLAVGTPIITGIKTDPDNIISKNNLGVVVKDFSKLDNAINTIISNQKYDILAKRCRDYLLKNHEPIILSRKFIENLKMIDKGN